MADKRISDLGAASIINPSDISVLVDGGVNYKYTFTLLLSLISQNLPVGADISFGTTMPSNTFGNNGDIFINTSAQSFAQKELGVWTVVYTITATGQLDGTVLFGTSTPPGTMVGNNGDTYINTTTGVFYKKATGAWVQVFSMLSGPPGARGNSILNGLIAPDNTVGVNGDFYLDTVHLNIYGPKAGGVWTSGTSLAPGVPNTILHGAGSPSNGLGNNGDYYINTATWYIFGPKAANVWPSGVSILSTPPTPDVFITAGTSIPKNLINGVDFTTILLRPAVTQSMPKTIVPVSGPTVYCDTTNGANTIVVYRFTDNTKTALASIDIYGNDDGSGLFAQDTWVHIN